MWLRGSSPESRKHLVDFILDKLPHDVISVSHDMNTPMALCPDREERLAHCGRDCWVVYRVNNELTMTLGFRIYMYFQVL